MRFLPQSKEYPQSKEESSHVSMLGVYYIVSTSRTYTESPRSKNTVVHYSNTNCIIIIIL